MDGPEWLGPPARIQARLTGPQHRALAVRALVDAEPVSSLASQTSVVAWLHRLCSAAARALPAAGAGVSVMTEGGVGAVTAASDPVSRELEELQFSLGEGPCFDAFASRSPVLEPDLSGAAAGRWPGYGPAARALGVAAVFAFPLQVGAARLGVLDVYRALPGSLTAPSLTQALTFAEVALDALLDAQAASATGLVPVGMDRTFDAHSAVYQAQGIVMVDLAVSLTDAMARLRAYAFAHDRRLDAVADDIVAGRLRLDPDPPPAA